MQLFPLPHPSVSRFFGAVLALLVLLTGRVSMVSADEPAQHPTELLQFNRDIRPLLSDRCFLCHGPDQTSEPSKETDLRLDLRDSAVEYGVFDFDDVDESEILLRISADDSDQMPPTSSHKQRLSESETDLIRRWIKQGAQYETHWAYLPVRRPETPTTDHPERIANPIDAFVIQKLESLQLSPAPTADRATLIRRASLDLTGLPPDIEEVDAFVSDPAALDQAYEAVVDRLLASPAYAEKMTKFWLDAARYADSGGYQYDLKREQWVWRDWVIHAFDTNKPFDQFTIEQIAGDMLENATDQTRLATGFNRNHPITIEGGVIDEEYRTEYVIDRVATTSTVFMGQTYACARCHDHKFDPISQRDFFSFYAFFNNVPEKGFQGFDPRKVIGSPLALAKQNRIKQELAATQTELENLDLPFQQWEEKLRSEQPTLTRQDISGLTSSGGATPKPMNDGSLLLTGTNPANDTYTVELNVAEHSVAEIQLEALGDESLAAGSPGRAPNGNFVLTEFVVEVAQENNPSQFEPVQIASAYADFEQDGYPISAAIDGKLDRTGWAVEGNIRHENRSAIFELADPVPVGATIRVKLIHQFGGSHQIGRVRLSFSPQVGLADFQNGAGFLAADQRTDEQSKQLRQLLVRRYANQQAKHLIDRLTSLSDDLTREKTPATMIMAEQEIPRIAYVLDRGEYDKPLKDDPVSPSVPNVFGTFSDDLPKNRLGLAKWLVSRDNPLTARVTVNRYWQHLFGIGIVKTTADFGSQGEYPSNPELLDWLAAEFMESDWNVKGILKTIVMSNTYRQSSVVTAEAFAADPENRLLARGSRFRLGAEEIRDSALAVSGLLLPTLGGPSVYPYHPDGLWLEINNRPGLSERYPHQTDLAQHHRRTLYSYWKRTVTPPSAAAFDAPSREYCIVRRSRTNTPLQAFVMLHDTQFIEAAIHLATRMMTDGGGTAQEQIEYGFRLCTAREPTKEELAILVDAFQQRQQQYTHDADAGHRVLSVGLTPVDQVLDRADLAAMTQVARMLMNLSEFITKG